MRKLALSCIGAAVMLLSTAALAEPEGTIDKLLQGADGTIKVYDDNRKLIRAIPLKEMPATPIPIVAFNKNNGAAKVRIGAEEVWLASPNFISSRLAPVATVCQAAQRLKPPAEGTPGTSRGLDKSCP
jgi:hypothetical protein